MDDSMGSDKPMKKNTTWVLLFGLLLPSLVVAQGKKQDSVKIAWPEQARFEGRVLHVDSVQTKKLGGTIYTDSTKSSYVVLKFLPDGTLLTEKGARYAWITDKALTPGQLQSLYLESEALALDFIASQAKTKARQELK